jgi:hypothetical protein
MKTIVKNILVTLSLLLVFSCQEEDNVFGDLSAPTNLTVQATVVGASTANPNGDGSGVVNFVATATNAISYKYVFSDGTTANAPSGQLQKRFTQPGTNEYTITVTASGKGGVSTTTTLTLQVRSDFTDAEAVQFLTGNYNTILCTIRIPILPTWMKIFKIVWC